MPAAVVDELGMKSIGDMKIGGLGGTVHLLDIYGVVMGIHEYPPRPVRVVANDSEPWVLLGRDVINHYRLVLDGPKLSLEIDPPAAS